MSYKRELLDHAETLRREQSKIDFSADPDASEKSLKFHRLIEIIEFICSHPDDAAAAIKRDE